MSQSGWIGVDLDGTLAHYAGWNAREVHGWESPDVGTSLVFKEALGSGGEHFRVPSVGQTVVDMILARYPNDTLTAKQFKALYGRCRK